MRRLQVKTCAIRVELLIDVPHGHAVVFVVPNGLVHETGIAGLEIIPVADQGFEGAKAALAPVESQGWGDALDGEPGDWQVHRVLDDLF